MKVFHIYRVTNITNQKVYIGFTGQKVNQRWCVHKCDARHNRRPGCVFQAAIRKYGVDSFIVEEIYCSQDGVHTKEIMEPLFIETYHSFLHDPLGPGYNMTRGGEGAIGCRRDAESYERGRLKRLGRKHSEETKNLIREAAREWDAQHAHDPEHSRKLSESLKGRKLSPAHIEKLRVSSGARRHSNATKAKIGASSRGRVMTPKAKELLRQWFAGVPTPAVRQTAITIAQILAAGQRTRSELTEITGLTNGQLRQPISLLLREGEIRRVKKGVYHLA